jgi:hypothetical protein
MFPDLDQRAPTSSQEESEEDQARLYLVEIGTLSGMGLLIVELNSQTESSVKKWDV